MALKGYVPLFPCLADAHICCSRNAFASRREGIVSHLPTGGHKARRYAVINHSVALRTHYYVMLSGVEA